MTEMVSLLYDRLGRVSFGGHLSNVVSGGAKLQLVVCVSWFKYYSETSCPFPLRFGSSLRSPFNVIVLKWNRMQGRRS